MVERVVFGVVPAALALIVLIISVRSVIRAFGVVQVLLAFPTLYLTVTSLWVLKRMMFDKAWPTFYPYFAIALAIPLALTQWYLVRRRQSASLYHLSRLPTDGSDLTGRSSS